MTGPTRCAHEAPGSVLGLCTNSSHRSEHVRRQAPTVAEVGA